MHLLPVLQLSPDDRGRLQLPEWELRSDIDQFIVNLTGRYGSPIVHARADNLHVPYQDVCPALSPDDVAVLWSNEQLLRPVGLTTVDFCERCACRRTQAAA